MGLAARLNGYHRRAIYEWTQVRHRAAARKREVAFQSWLDALSAKPPDVLVGANFASYGGVRHHIQAIQRYSSLNVGFAPPESVVGAVGAHHLQQEFRERFLDFPASGIKVVHSHVFPWFIEWCREKQKQGMRWVHTYHLNYFPEHGRNGLEPWQADINDALINVARHADVRLSVSMWQRDHLLEEYGIETTYLPNGVDLALCEAADGARFRRRHRLENFILWVGRNDPVKNPAEFVRLAERLPQHACVMVGGGLSRAVLEQEWNLSIPRNLLMVGPLPHREVLDAIAACSVLVVTSKREGLPTLVMEGMALAKPIVVPDEAGCREVIGETGLLYLTGDLDQLAQQVSLAGTEHWLGEKARERVVAHFDWRIVASSLDEVYGLRDWGS